MFKHVVVALAVVTAGLPVLAHAQVRGAGSTAAAPVAQTPWQELYRQTVGQLSTGGCLEPATLYLKVIETRGNPRHSH